MIVYEQGSPTIGFKNLLYISYCTVAGDTKTKKKMDFGFREFDLSQQQVYNLLCPFISIILRAKIKKEEELLENLGHINNYSALL